MTTFSFNKFPDAPTLEIYLFNGGKNLFKSPHVPCRVVVKLTICLVSKPHLFNLRQKIGADCLMETA